MSEVSKVVFAAFTQNCIQSNVTKDQKGNVRGVKGLPYPVYRGFLSLQEGRPVQQSVLLV